ESNLSAKLIFIAVAKHPMAVGNSNRLVRWEADLSVSPQIAWQCRAAIGCQILTDQRSRRAIVGASGEWSKTSADLASSEVVNVEAGRSRSAIAASFAASLIWRYSAPASSWRRVRPRPERSLR